MPDTHVDWPNGKPHGWLVLDGDHMVKPLLDLDEKPSGWHEAHRRDDGEWCIGAVARRGHGNAGQPEWDVLSEDPLTLSPSLLCRVCGSHGWVRDGRWVAA